VRRVAVKFDINDIKSPIVKMFFLPFSDTNMYPKPNPPNENVVFFSCLYCTSFQIQNNLFWVLWRIWCGVYVCKQSSSVCMPV
jgi:hypothetical protein